MLNPDLDRAALAEQFAVDGRVRIENILDITADEMTNLSEEQLCFIAEVSGWFRAIPL